MNESNFPERDIELLFGVKNIVSRSAEHENLKYSENNHSVAVSENPATKTVNNVFFLNKNNSTLKNKITQ